MFLSYKPEATLQRGMRPQSAKLDHFVVLKPIFYMQRLVGEKNAGLPLTSWAPCLTPQFSHLTRLGR
jgi:hypothetical protein